MHRKWHPVKVSTGASDSSKDNVFTCKFYQNSSWNPQS